MTAPRLPVTERTLANDWVIKQTDQGNWNVFNDYGEQVGRAFDEQTAETSAYLESWHESERRSADLRVRVRDLETKLAAVRTDEQLAADVDRLQKALADVRAGHPKTEDRRQRLRLNTLKAQDLSRRAADYCRGLEGVADLLDNMGWLTEEEKQTRGRSIELLMGVSSTTARQMCEAGRLDPDELV